MEEERTVAKALLGIGAVGFSLETPLVFKSGILSPVYCDNRILPSHPKEWRVVIEAFASMLKRNATPFDVVAGVEAAGIPHSAALGFHLGVPSVFVRKQAKDHGTKKLVEGEDVAGKRVVLVEDLVTTGGSSLAAVNALREAGAEVNDVLVIVTYAFPESEQAFKEAGIVLHPLVSFDAILEEALTEGKIGVEEVDVVRSWMRDPHSWDDR